MEEEVVEVEEEVVEVEVEVVEVEEELVEVEVEEVVVVEGGRSRLAELYALGSRPQSSPTPPYEKR